MSRVLQTTIGNGNRFNDISFVWFPHPAALYRPLPLESLAATVGLSLGRILDGSNGQDVQQALEEALVSSPPVARASDAINFVLDFAKALDGLEERRRLAAAFTRWLEDGRRLELAELYKRQSADFRGYNPDLLRRNVRLAFQGETVVVERSPPSAVAVTSLLSKGSGVALGAYLGFQAAAGSPMLLYASVPGGILLCCTAAGIAEALQLGLRERVFRWIAGTPQPTEISVADTLKTTLGEIGREHGRGHRE